MEPIRRAAAGEVDVPIEGASPGDAIAEYYLAYKTALLRRMRSRLDEADAEDVVQEIFIQARRDIGRYDPARSAPQTWLARLGDQILSKRYRRRFHRQRAEVSYAQDRESARSLTTEERIEICQLLERLTHINHRIIAARFFLGESAEEIAIRTGLSVDAVKKRITRSMERLRVSIISEDTPIRWTAKGYNQKKAGRWGEPAGGDGQLGGRRDRSMSASPQSTWPTRS